MAQHDDDDYDYENDDMDGSNLIVNYLPDDMSEIIMYDMFAKYGEVDSVRIIRDRLTQAPRGYGFVKYKHPDSARAAIENLDGLHIMQKKLKVALSRPGGVRLKANLFIGSLPPSFGEEDLTRLFSDFHPIIDVRILRFSDGTSKQCGFVRLDNDVLATQAIEQLNGITADGYRIQVKHAHGKRRRRPPGRGHVPARGPPQTSNYSNGVPFANYAPPPQSFRAPENLYDSFQPQSPNQNANWPPPRAPQMGMVNPNLYSPQLYANEYSSTPPNASPLLMNQSPIIVSCVPPQGSPLINHNQSVLQNPGVYTPPLAPVMVVTPPLTPNLVPSNFTLTTQMPLLDLNSGASAQTYPEATQHVDPSSQEQQINTNTEQQI